MSDRVSMVVEDLERFMTTVDDALSLSREASQFVHALVLSAGAQYVVEIGTSYGYSGLWIASALKDTGGRLTTIDCDPRKSKEASARFRAAGLSELVDVRTGDASDVLSDLEGPIDFVLNDADKENCRQYVELVTEKLVVGGAVLTDNTVSHGEQLTSFVSWIRSQGAFFSTHVPIGSGMELSVKR